MRVSEESELVLLFTPVLFPTPKKQTRSMRKTKKGPRMYPRVKQVVTTVVNTERGIVQLLFSVYCGSGAVFLEGQQKHVSTTGSTSVTTTL